MENSTKHLRSSIAYKVPVLLVLLLLIFNNKPHTQAQEFQDSEASPILHVELFDSTGTLSSFENVIFVALFLPDNFLPFDELTQGQWNFYFEKILNPNTSPLTDPELAPFQGLREAIPGRIFTSPVSGRATLEGLPLRKRIVLAAKHEGLWWPIKREFWFDAPSEEREARLELHALSTDLSLLKASEYTFSVNHGKQFQGARWHQVELQETLRIVNLSTTHAVIGKEAFENQGWLRFPLTPPPGLPPIYLTQSMLLNSWSYFVGQPTEEVMPFESTPETLSPYVPWSSGLDWGENHHRASDSENTSFHGTNINHYHTQGPKRSEDNAHPFNREGRFEFIAPGENYLSMQEEELHERLDLVINKPIPPGGSMVIFLKQEPGILFEQPESIQIYRPPLPFDIEEVRISHSPLYNLQGRNALVLKKAEQDNDGMLRPLAQQNDLGITIPRGSFFGLEIQAAPELLAAMSELDLGLENQEEPSKTTPALTPPKEPSLTESPTRLFSLLAALFGFVFFIILIRSIRGNEQEQRTRLEKNPASEEQLLQELQNLKVSYTQGKLPAKTYQEEHRRLLTWLVQKRLEQ